MPEAFERLRNSESSPASAATAQEPPAARRRHLFKLLRTRIGPWLFKTSIGPWLFVTPLIAIVLFASVVLMTLQSFRSQETILADIRSGAVQRLENISRMANRISAANASIILALEHNGADSDSDRIVLDERTAESINALSAIEREIAEQPGRYVAPDTDQADLQELLRVFSLYRTQTAEAIRLAKAGDPDTARLQGLAWLSYQALLPLRERLTTNALVRMRELTEAIGTRAAQVSRNLIFVLVGTGLISLMVAWGISLILSRDILGRIRTMSRLAGGESGVEIQGLERHDEIGDLARATRVFADTLRRLREEIEQREKTEDALRAERNFVSAINETVGALILVLDRTGRIVRFNRACEALTDYGLGDIAGTRPWDRLVAPEDRSRMREGIASLNADCQHNEFETAWTTAQGENRMIAWSNTTLVDAQGEIEYVICCGIDITERKVGEDRLRQAHRMEAVGQLTGGIAHDFNNLLAVILIDLDLVLRRLPDDDHSRRMVEHAISAGQRGAALTNRLLSFSRQQPLRPETVRLDALIEGAISLVVGAVGNDISVSHESGADLWTCTVDPRQLVEALLNLTLNARDAMPEGGQLQFRLRNTRLLAEELPEDSGLEPGDYVELSVTDTGSGIPDDVRPRIFEPFFTTKPIGKGSGLGLSMVYGFMKQSHGHVTVNSMADWGTTFRLYFPSVGEALDDAAVENAAATPAPRAIESQPAVAASAAAPAADASPHRVLLVEDEPDLRSLTHTLLEELGYEVLEAASAKEALALLGRTRRCDILFADLLLPGGMGGQELATAANVMQPTLKVLYMSGDPRAANRDALATTDHDQILRKPFRRDDLDRALREALAS